MIVHGSYIAVDLPSVPHAASPRSLRVSEDTYDAIDAFFGVTRATRTVCVSGIRDSCHDSTPPPYPHHNELPEYSSRDAEAGFKEPATLAMYLFKYGFCESRSCLLSHLPFIHDFSVPAILVYWELYPLYTTTRTRRPGAH